MAMTVQKNRFQSKETALKVVTLSAEITDTNTDTDTDTDTRELILNPSEEIKLEALNTLNDVLYKLIKCDSDRRKDSLKRESDLSNIIKAQGEQIESLKQELKAVINVTESEEQELLKEFLKEEANEIQNNRKDDYIYIIKCIDINTMRPYYKVGETQRHPMNRIKEHGHQNKVILLKSVNDSIKAEKVILSRLKSSNQVICRTDIGRECFECKDDITMDNLVSGYVLDLYSS
jgi:hypothetical protein